MATTYADVMTEVIAGGDKIDNLLTGGKIRAFTETVQYDGQAAGTIVVARIPKDCVILGFVLVASATAGASATLALGIAGSTGLFRAAATYTTANTPTLVNTAAGTGYITTAETDILLTTAVAALPTSADYLKVITLYTSLN